jgi:hypothetical protein
MLKQITISRTLIAMLLTLTLLISTLFFPVVGQIASTIVLIISISMAILLVLQKHWKSYQQAECTYEKMIRTLTLDLLGLLLTMAAAMYVGRLAGGYFGLHVGFWVGLLAGLIGGFVAAWAVRSVWGRLVPLA